MGPQERTGRLLRALIMGAMVACTALAREDLIAWMGFRLSRGVLVLIPLLAALESSATRRVIEARPQWRLEIARRRLVEFGLLFLMVRLLSYLGRSWADVLAEVGSWLANPVALVGPDMLLGLGVAMLSWWATNATERDVGFVGQSPRLDWQGRSLRQRPPRAAVATRVVAGGIALLGITALPEAGLGLGSTLHWARPLGSEPYLVAYSLLGLTLLAHVQLVVLEHGWKIRGVRVSRGLAGRWLRYSVVTGALATVVALLLPTGYSVGLFDLLARAALPLVTAVSYLLYVLLVAALFVVAILGKLSSLLFGTVSSRFDPAELEPPTIGELGPLPAWLDILRSVVFWAAVLAAAVYVVRSYLRDHPGALQGLFRMGLLRRLREAVLSLKRQLSGVTAGVRRLVSGEGRRSRRRSRSGRRFRLIRPGSLPPRERIRYYYAVLLRRAARSGLPRDASQTPLEYEAAVRPALSGGGEDLRLLTRAFVEARYSAHSVTSKQAKEARAQVRRLTAALRSAAKVSGAPARR